MAPDRYELRDDARRFETWENNYAARLGLGIAIDYALAIGLDEIEARCRAISSELRASLAELPGVTLHDLGPRPAAIVSFSSEKHEASVIKNQLAAAGINVSASSPSSTLLDAKARNLPIVVRASPHYYNISPEVEALAAAIRSLS